MRALSPAICTTNLLPMYRPVPGNKPLAVARDNNVTAWKDLLRKARCRNYHVAPGWQAYIQSLPCSPPPPSLNIAFPSCHVATGFGTALPSCNVATAFHAALYNQCFAGWRCCIQRHVMVNQPTCSACYLTRPSTLQL